jgi:4-carboxymuconolactone decarboxylase
LKVGKTMMNDTTLTGRELSERLNPGMEDALNARYGHLLPGMAEGVVDFAYGRQYARPGLPLRDRYLATIAALAALGGQTRLDLSRFRAAPSARLSYLSFESDGAFPAQC